MPYYNRRNLLYNVLRYMNYSDETIIVDDGSSKEHEVYDFKDTFPNLNIRIIRLDRDSRWRGAAIAYNIGFSEATGDVILINSSECVHLGDILGYVKNNLQPKSYMAFSSYAATPEINSLIDSGNLDRVLRTDSCWHSHSTHYTLIPYCAAISKEDMDILGGYDERFVKGVGYDDYEFIDRVKNLGLNTQLIDNPCVVHQWHPTLNLEDTNLELWQSMRITNPDRIRPPENTYYTL